jgi:protein-disulfide isomerase
MHPMAMPAAKRYEAIAMQSPEKAVQYHDELFTHQDAMNEEGEKYLDEAAKKVGADMAKMKKDMNSPAVKKQIEADSKEARKFGFTGTPGYIVEGAQVAGAYPFDFFKGLVDYKLSKK